MLTAYQPSATLPTGFRPRFADVAESPPPAGNRLLAALRADEYARLAPGLERVRLVRGQVLGEPGRPWRHLHFPVDAVVSLLHATAEGGSSGVALVGREGVVGVSLFMGGDSGTGSAVVQVPGDAVRVEARALRDEFLRGGPLQRLLLRYIQALLAQMAQTAVCNRHHSVDQQLCRWLLNSLDRLPGNRVDLTQERLAQLMGVRREGVTEAARKLWRAGFIDYWRGHITVLDRSGLEARVCECYGAVRRECERLLP